MRSYDAETILINGLRASLGMGVPKGAKPETRGRVAFYPWLEMEVGESFTFRDHVKPGSARVVACIANKKYAPRRYATKTMRADGRRFSVCTRTR